jgi:prophage maintenance system killer protein
MIELIERNGHRWNPPEGSDEQVEIIEALAAREITEAEFADWVRNHIAVPE